MFSFQDQTCWKLAFKKLICTRQIFLCKYIYYIKQFFPPSPHIPLKWKKKKNSRNGFQFSPVVFLYKHTAMISPSLRGSRTSHISRADSPFRLPRWRDVFLDLIYRSDANSALTCRPGRESPITEHSFGHRGHQRPEARATSNDDALFRPARKRHGRIIRGDCIRSADLPPSTMPHYCFQDLRLLATLILKLNERAVACRCTSTRQDVITVELRDVSNWSDTIFFWWFMVARLEEIYENWRGYRSSGAVSKDMRYW